VAVEFTDWAQVDAFAGQIAARARTAGAES
jgi:menaquinone-dependent protoporphyrinogen IX oxidase